jgi:hypothetical protein
VRRNEDGQQGWLLEMGRVCHRVAR